MINFITEGFYKKITKKTGEQNKFYEIENTAAGRIQPGRIR